MSRSNTNQAIPDATPTPQGPISVLERFIFEPDELASVTVPRRLSPPEVAKFLSESRLNRNLSVRSWRQVEKVADFYDATELPEVYKKFLDRTEAGAEDRLKSIIISKVIATLGNAEYREVAKQYYLYLTAHAESSEEFEELTSLNERLAPLVGTTELRVSLNKALSALESKKETDYQARIEFLKLQETFLPELEVLKKAAAIEAKTLGTSIRQQRVDEEVKLYVTNDLGLQDRIQPFAARRLRRETWSSSIAEQTLRNDDAPFKEDVVKSLRTFLDSLNKRSNMENAVRDTYRIRTMRAIKFFGANLSPAEEAFLRANRGKQIDILANEGLLIQS